MSEVCVIKRRDGIEFIISKQCYDIHIKPYNNDNISIIETEEWFPTIECAVKTYPCLEVVK